MRNFITVVALFVSMTGIFVSLAREELRCKLGLNSSDCSTVLRKTEPNSVQNNPSVERPQSISRPSASVLSIPEKNTEEKAINVRESKPSVELPIVNNSDNATDIIGQKSLKPAQDKNEQTETAPAKEQANSINTEIPLHEKSQMDTGSSSSSSESQSSPNVTTDSQPIPVIPPSPDSQN